jgi:D-alanyl-D-alanine carboxypeptidase
VKVRRPSSLVACLAAALAFGAAPAPAPEHVAVRLEDAYKRLDEFIARTMRDERTPGLAVGLTDRKGLLHVGTHGLSDLGARTPLTSDRLFQIGSISKSFTAVALLQLRDEGKFDPRAPIVRYLPWFKIQTTHPPITAHDLLSHTAGLPRDRDDVPSSLYQAVALAERSTGSAPGAHYAYSNIGYQVLGYVLEAVAKRPYAEIIGKRIFEPLGMTNSEAAITHDLRPRLAVGYERLYDDRPTHPGQPLVPGTWVEYGAGDGSISATAADLAAYLRMILNRGSGPRGPILSKGSFDLLIQRAVKTGEGEHYGYGLTVRDVGGHTVLSHSGGMIGYSSYMVGDLDDGLGVAVLVNGPGDPEGVAEFGLEVLRAAYNGKDLPALPAPKSPDEVTNAADFAGAYVSPDGKALTLVVEGKKLMLQRGARRIVLERREEGEFYLDDPEFGLYLLRFGRDKGAVVEAFHGPDWYANDRYAGPRRFDHPRDWEAYPGHYRTTHPWFSNFRIVLRKGHLSLIAPEGEEQVLVPLEKGTFRVGEKELSAERLRFDSVIDGKALRANLSGVTYYRSFTP